MNRLALFAVALVTGWYIWWRVRRRFASIMATVRRPEPEKDTAAPMTLVKDPVTGVYRPPKG